MHRSGTDEGAASNVNRIFFALSDPTRRRLLDRLHERDGQRLHELTVDFDISRQAISKHLDVLADAALIIIRRRGERGTPEHHLNRALIRHVHSQWMSRYLHAETGVGSA
jgi:DNA-binding transcriptional ArsR family regulator